ncbi:hypothetical protein [Streptomyces sp. TS71-3]|uniref:hypothetical protein n=1 Tax=Streptomyces sp. TS71-3 TaxID=2733862 RepID=UPI001BB44E22|nr:hypothetical protein [Streptomyces sp. TS71-3]
MLKGLVHGLAWSLATGAAVTLSWWGVHTVLAGTAYDPPRAVPITGGGMTPDATEPLSSSTHRPRPSPSPTPRTHSPQPPPPSHGTPPKQKPSDPPSPSAPQEDTDEGVVRGYDTPGGRVVLDISRASASLVSATPDPGWSMQVWKEPDWIRVEFTRDSDEVSVFCTWNGHQPQVQIVTY